MSADLEGVFQPTPEAPTMGGGQSLPVSPDDGYGVVIVESEMRQTQAGTGTMLSLTCKVMDGQHAGTEGIWNLNLGNPNPTTVRIAQNELNCICHAVGHTGPLQNTEPLHNKPFRLVVKAQKNKDGSINEDGYVNVTKVLRADGSKLTDPPGGAAPNAPAPAPAAPAAVAPPAAPAPAPAAPAQPAITTAVAPPAAVAQPAPAAAPPAAPAAAPAQPGWPAQPAAAAPPAAVAPAAPAAPAAAPAQPPVAPPAAVAPGGQPWNAAPQ